MFSSRNRTWKSRRNAFSARSTPWYLAWHRIIHFSFDRWLLYRNLRPACESSRRKYIIAMTFYFIPIVYMMIKSWVTLCFILFFLFIVAIKMDSTWQLKCIKSLNKNNHPLFHVKDLFDFPTLLRSSYPLVPEKQKICSCCRSQIKKIQIKYTFIWC